MTLDVLNKRKIRNRMIMRTPVTFLFLPSPFPCQQKVWCQNLKRVRENRRFGCGDILDSYCRAHNKYNRTNKTILIHSYKNITMKAFTSIVLALCFSGVQAKRPHSFLIPNTEIVEKATSTSR